MSGWLGEAVTCCPAAGMCCLMRASTRWPCAPWTPNLKRALRLHGARPAWALWWAQIPASLQAGPSTREREVTHC